MSRYPTWTLGSPLLSSGHTGISSLCLRPYSTFPLGGTTIPVYKSNHPAATPRGWSSRAILLWLNLQLRHYIKVTLNLISTCQSVSPNPLTRGGRVHSAASEGPRRQDCVPRPTDEPPMLDSHNALYSRTLEELVHMVQKLIHVRKQKEKKRAKTTALSDDNKVNQQFTQESSVCDYQRKAILPRYTRRNS